MSESEIPSKTDTATVKTTQLTSSELEYLKSLQEQNRQLTLILGDKAMEFEYAKKALLDHRDVFSNSIRTTLSMHGAPGGRIDISTGTVTVLPQSN